MDLKNKDMKQNNIQFEDAVKFAKSLNLKNEVDELQIIYTVLGLHGKYQKCIKDGYDPYNFFTSLLIESGFSDDEIRSQLNGDAGIYAIFKHFEKNNHIWYEN